MRCARISSGFSLLELLVVLALLGMVAALVAPGVVRMSLGDPRNTDVSELSDTLAGARLDALRRSTSTVVTLRVAEGGLTAQWGDDARAWADWPLAIVDEGQRVFDSAQVRFSATGRADRREIRLLEADTGRMWRIEFAVASGAPQWRRIEAGED